MSCTFVRTETGVMIICSRGRETPTTCAHCSHTATKLCDGHAPLKFGVKEARTCDRPLCDKCAIHVHPNLDYCREHAPK